MTDRGEPPPTAGHPGPRWQGDGSLGGPPPARSGDPPQAPGGRDRVASDAGERDYASFWRRAAAWLVDEALVKTFLWLTIILLVTFITGGVPQSSSEELDVLALLPRLILSVGYDWVFWSQGWTPGATLLGIRIVREDGEPPGATRAAARVGGSAISSLALFIGYLWMLRSPHRQTWHDIFAGTYVVNAPREEPTLR